MLRILDKIEFAIGALLLGAIVTLVFGAALLRSFGHPLIWSIDMAQLLFIWLCFFGAVRALRQKGHIGIDILVRHLPYRFRFTLEMTLSLLMLVFLALLANEGTRLALSNMQRQMGDSGLSYFWVTMAVPVGCAMLAVALAYNMVRAWRRRGNGHTLVYSRSDTDIAQIPTEL